MDRTYTSRTEAKYSEYMKDRPKSHYMYHSHCDRAKGLTGLPDIE